MKQLIIAKKGTVSAKDVVRAEKNGFIIIEHENPQKVKIVWQFDKVNNEAIIHALIESLHANGWDRNFEAFGRNLIKKILPPKP